MTDLKLAAGDWLVVCDRRKALLLERVGKRAASHLETVAVYDHRIAGGELEIDSHGHAHPFIGPPCSGLPGAAGDETECRFIQGLVHRLNEAVGTGKVKHLIIVAPPSALTLLREAYTPAVRAALLDEIANELVRLPVPEIARHLFGDRAGRAPAPALAAGPKHAGATKVPKKRAQC